MLIQEMQYQGESFPPLPPSPGLPVDVTMYTEPGETRGRESIFSIIEYILSAGSLREAQRVLRQPRPLLAVAEAAPRLPIDFPRQS